MWMRRYVLRILRMNVQRHLQTFIGHQCGMPIFLDLRIWRVFRFQLLCDEKSIQLFLLIPKESVIITQSDCHIKCLRECQAKRNNGSFHRLWSFFKAACQCAFLSFYHALPLPSLFCCWRKAAETSACLVVAKTLKWPNQSRVEDTQLSSKFTFPDMLFGAVKRLISANGTRHLLLIGVYIAFLSAFAWLMQWLERPYIEMELKRRKFARLQQRYR